MNNINSAREEFLTSFVQTCYEQGFTAKQASELFETYMNFDLASNSEHFNAGFKEEMDKQAGLMQALKTLGTSAGNLALKHKGIVAPAVAGAGLAAAGPAGLIPEDWKGSAGLGAGLGGGAALLMQLLGGRGRGLGSALARLGGAVRRGGVGRTALGLGGSLLTNKGMLKGVGRGALAGAAATGTAALMNKGINIPGRYPNMPAMQAAMPQGGGEYYGGGGGGGFNPFGLPSDIAQEAEAYNQPMGGAPAASGMFAAQQNAISGYKSQLNDLDAQIQTMQSSLPSANNPAAYAQRMQAQQHLDNLKAQRNLAVRAIEQQEKQLQDQRSSMTSNALQQQMLAQQGMGSAQEEFDNLRGYQQAAQGGGLMGGLAGVYNKLRGTDKRIAELAPMYQAYYDANQNALNLQNAANQ